MNGDYVLDTNVLIYAFDSSERRKRDIAEKMLSDAIESGAVLCLQNISEFFNVSTKSTSTPIPKEEASEIVKLLLQSKNIRVVKARETTLLTAIEISKKNHFWDSMIMATMLENQVYTIYTENVKDFKDSRIKAINPFKR